MTALSPLPAATVPTPAALSIRLETPDDDSWIEALHASGVELVVTGWVDQNETSIVRAKGEALRQVKLAIQAAGIVIPDATQAIQLTRETKPLPQELLESTQVETVEASEDAALDRIVDAERHEEITEDLLRQDSMKE